MGSRLLVCLLICGCGDSVHDLHIGEPPLVTLKGQIDRDTLPDPDAPLFGALVWADRPAVNRFCKEFSIDLREACPDPLGVTYLNQPQVVRKVDQNGYFELPVYSARPEEALFGSLIVVQSVADPNTLDYARRWPVIPPGSGLGEYDERPDPIVAATFHSLRTRQLRLVNNSSRPRRVGDDYPVPGRSDCAPPPGFSWLSIAERSAGPCANLSTQEIVRLDSLSDAESLALVCRPRQSASLAQLANTAAPMFLPSDRLVCLQGDMMAAIASSECHPMTVWSLQGCSAYRPDPAAVDPFCDTPDRRVAAPPWWPCHLTTPGPTP
jgi:hypothetical protein